MEQQLEGNVTENRRRRVGPSRITFGYAIWAVWCLGWAAFWLGATPYTLGATIPLAALSLLGLLVPVGAGRDHAGRAARVNARAPGRSK